MNLKLLTLNVHATSNPKAVGVWLREVLRDIDPHAVFLSELTLRHIAAIRTRTFRTHKLFVGDERPGANEVGVLLDKDIPVVRDYNVPMGNRRWFGRHTGKKHTPRNMRVVQLKNGLHVASVHLPPGVDCTPHGLTGPQDRQDAWVAWHRKFRQWAGEDFDFIAAGDWNEHARVRFPWSPRATARAIENRVEVPVELASLGTIDYVMARGARITPLRQLRDVPEGLDHVPGLYKAEFE